MGIHRATCFFKIFTSKSPTKRNKKTMEITGIGRGWLFDHPIIFTKYYSL